MDRMKKIMTVIAVPACVALLACGNKEKQTEPMAIDDLPAADELQADTIATSVHIESSKGEESLPPRVNSSSSSLNTSRSTKYDNMRGFDPVSEDDMDDNGMSRYMENNDEEGWD